jgi:copper chaperone CopZ
MKNIFNLIVILMLSLAFTTSCGSSANEEKVEKPEVVADSETKLAIEGMMCEKGCVGLISKELTKMTGVGEFDINFEEASAEIEYDSKQTNVEEIISMIEGLADHSYKASIFEEVQEMEMEEVPASEETEESLSETTEEVEA